MCAIKITNFCDKRKANRANNGSNGGDGGVSGKTGLPGNLFNEAKEL
jgi:hypothetical protein